MIVFLTKLVIFVLCIAILNLLRETFTLYQCYKNLEEYKIDSKRLMGLWASIAYIITIIITGIL